MNKLILFFKSRRNFLIFSFLKLSTQIIALSSSIFIVQKLEITEFGSYSLILTLVGFASTFGFSWTSSTLIYFGGKEKKKYGNLNKSFWSRNILLLFSLLIVTSLFILFKKEINVYVEGEYIVYILAWLYIRVVQDYLSYYFLAINKQLVSSTMVFLSRLILLLIVCFSNYDLKQLLTLSILSELVTLIFIFKINKEDFGSFEFDKAYFKEILKFSLWQLFGFSGVYLINFGDNFIIKYYLDISNVAIYNSAYKIFTGVAMLSYVISSYYASTISVNFAEKNTNKVKNFYYKERYLLMFLTSVLHLIIIFYSDLIITTLYGNRYSEAIIVLQILMIGSLLRYVEVFYVIYYNTNNKYRFLQMTNILQAIFNIVLSIIFVKYFGIVGAAISTTLAMAIKSLISILYCEKRILYFIKNN